MRKIQKAYKRPLLLILALIVITGQLLIPRGVNANPVLNDKIKLSVKVAGDSQGIVQRGQSFQLEYELENTQAADITDVTLTITPTPGLVPGGASWVTDTGDTVLAGAKYRFATINMVYNGNDSSLPIEAVATFKTGGTDEINVPVTIYLGVHIPQTTPSPTDTSKYRPGVMIKRDTEIPIFDEGREGTISFPLINREAYDARDVEVFLDGSDMDSMPFILDRVSLGEKFDGLAAGEEKTISFPVKIKPGIASGIYSFKVNYTFFNAYSDKFSGSDTFYIKIVNEKTPANLTLDRFITTVAEGSIPGPGDLFSLTLLLKNMGDQEAQNIKVSLDGLTNTSIYVTRTSDVKYVESIPGNATEQVEYFLTVSEDYKGNNVSLVANMEYTDVSGTVLNSRYQFFLPIQKIEEEEEEEEEEEILLPSISIFDIEYPKDEIEAGDEFKLSFKVINEGEFPGTNVKLSVVPEGGIYPISSPVVYFDSLKEWETEQLEFTFYAGDKTVTKNHSLEIIADYEKHEKDKVTQFQAKRYAGVFVLNPEKEEEEEEEEEPVKTVPKIIIDMYGFEPEDPKAGENFTLKLSFLNTSKLLPVRNVKVAFLAKEGVFIPVNSSNTFFIEAMGINEKVERQVELFTKADAQAKSHSLTITFEYEDEKGNQFTATEEISIPVTQEQKLSLGQLNMPSHVTQGQMIPIFIDFFNMGKSTLYNLMVSFESEDINTENSNYFVGNFEPGRGDYYEAMGFAQSEGSITGEIVFSFEDEAGNKSEVKKEVEVYSEPMHIMPPTEGEFYPEESFPEEQGIKKWITPVNLGIGGGVLVLAIVITIILVRRKKGRREDDFFDE